MQESPVHRPTRSPRDGRPASLVLAACVFAAAFPRVTLAQPLRFESTAPLTPDRGVAALAVAAQMEKEAGAIGVTADASRSAAASVRRIAAALVRSGNAEGEVGAERVLLGLTLARHAPAITATITKSSPQAGELAARLAALAQQVPTDTPGAELALRDALAPLANSTDAGTASFRAALWPGFPTRSPDDADAGKPPAAAPKPATKSDAPATPDTAKPEAAKPDFSAHLAALDAPTTVPLTLLPERRSLAAAAHSAASLAKKPAWLATEDHAWFIARLEPALRDAAASPPAPGAAASLGTLADIAESARLTDVLPAKDAKAARRALSAAISLSRGPQTPAKPPATPRAQTTPADWHALREILALAAMPPSPLESEVPTQMRTGVRHLLPGIAQSRSELVEALARAGDTSDYQGPALLNARVAHERRLAELRTLAVAARVIASGKADSSKTERGIRPGFEEIARRLRTAGRDLSSPSLRDVALAQFRELCSGLARFEPGPGEHAVRTLLGVDKNGAAPPAGAAPSDADADPAFKSAMQRILGKNAPSVAASIDAARKAWLDSWAPDPAARGNDKPDPADAQAAREAASRRLALTLDAVETLHDAAWAFANADPDSAASSRLLHWRAWELSQAGTSWTVAGLEKATIDVVSELSRATDAPRRVESLSGALDDAKNRFSPALLQGRLAYVLASMTAAEAGAAGNAGVKSPDESAPAPRPAGGPSRTVVAAPLLALAELASGPPPADAWLLAARHDLAVLCRELEEGAALASTGKSQDASRFAAAARAIATSLLEREELKARP